MWSDDNSVMSFCQDGPETVTPKMSERLKILFLVKMSVRRLWLVLVTSVGGHYLHRSCRCLANWKEPQSQTTMRRRSNDTTSRLPPVLQEQQNKQRSGRSYLVPTCQLSPSPPNNPGTPLAVSLRFLPVWPSCSCGSTLKVTLCTRRHCLSLPYHHQSHARTRWLLLSPRSCQQYTVHTITTPTVCCCSKAFTLHWMWEKIGNIHCTLVKALLIKMLFDSTLINPQRPRLPACRLWLAMWRKRALN